MDKPFEFVKSLIINYKLDSCCCLAPVRIGLIITGYFNIIVALISLMGTANESFPPTIVKVQEMILEDNATKPIPLLTYSTEMGFSVLLLCAIYRNDVVLLRVYMYYCLAAIILSLLVYSIVIAAIDVLVQIAIILSTAFQFYVLLLVRSAIVEIKAGKKNSEIPTIIMSTLLSESKEPPTKYVVDVEKPAEPEAEATESEQSTQKVENITETKLETVDESPKEAKE